MIFSAIQKTREIFQFKFWYTSKSIKDEKFFAWKFLMKEINILKKRSKPHKHKHNEFPFNAINPIMFIRPTTVEEFSFSIDVIFPLPALLVHFSVFLSEAESEGSKKIKIEAWRALEENWKWDE